METNENLSLYGQGGSMSKPKPASGAFPREMKESQNKAVKRAEETKYRLDIKRMYWTGKTAPNPKNPWK
jgi:hypothetical protein